MKTTTRLLATVALLTLSTPVCASEYVIMKVGGQDVSSAEAQRFWEGLFPAGQAPAFESVKPEVRDKVLRGVMAEQLLAAEAKKSGLEQSEAVQRQIEEVKRKIVIRALLAAKTADTITEEDLKKEYDALLASMKDIREVRARHILVSSETEARDARKKIESGKGFDEVARTLSKDAASAKQGGDLGYFTKDKMVKEFADAAFAMKKGEISAPVKTGFGWHIIKLEDNRAVLPPQFGEVKETLRTQLQEKKLNDYVTTLIKNAEIKVYDQQGKAVAFDKNIPPQALPTASATEAKPQEQPKADSKAIKRTTKPDATKEKKPETPAPKHESKPVETKPAEPAPAAAPTPAAPAKPEPAAAPATPAKESSVPATPATPAAPEGTN